MSILVLGGAGYIGSHTVYELIDRGEDVIVVDNLQTGFKAAVHPKARFYEGDIRDKAFLDDLFTKEKIDGVIHFAANSQVGESMKVPLKYYDNNLYGTMVLLESMVEHGIDKIVFSSTAATYGEPERIPILESDRTEPTNTYGETKLSMEKMMKWTSKAHNLRYVALRYFNACGAHISGKIGEAHNPETHLIPLVLQVPLGKRPYISIFGNDYDTPDGTGVRDYIHVVDLAKGHVKALQKIDENCGLKIYNLGTGKGYSVLDIVKNFEEATGMKVPYAIKERRPGDIATCYCDPGKAAKELGWKAENGIKEMCEDSWRWQKNNPNGYEN